MPESRPLSSLRWGQYDHPPASNTSNTTSSPNSFRRGDRHAPPVMTSHNAHPSMPSAPAEYPTALQRVMSQARRRPRSPESAADRHDSRHKRRKLHSSPTPPVRPAIRYGRYGQVEPGRLRMEILSCDGGEYQDPRHPHVSLGPENALRHDRSVYCSERASCNMILQHQDDNPFCLEKIHIVAPEGGFRSPVREGQVFVAMNLPDLLKYQDPPIHARRRGVHSPPYRNNRTSSSSEQISFSDALRDPAISAALDSHDRGGRSRFGSNQRDSANASSEREFGGRYDTFYIDEEDDEDELQGPDNYNYYSPRESPYRATDTITAPITFNCNDDLGPEDTTSAEDLRYRDHRERQALLQRFDVHNSWTDDQRWFRSPEPQTSSSRPRSRDSRRHPLPRRYHDNEPPTAWFADFDEPVELGSSDSPHPPPLPSSSRPVPYTRRAPRYNDRSSNPSLSHTSLPFIADLMRTASQNSVPFSGPPPPPPRQSVRSAVAPPPTTTKAGSGDINPRDDETITYTRFLIPPHRNKIAIRFDPPLSGRFVLLKLWGHKDHVCTDACEPGDGCGDEEDEEKKEIGDSVEVQSVILTGYGGCRYFPAIEVR